MSIPNSNRAPAPPPPLPPPTNVEELGLTQDQTWPFNNNNWQGFLSGGKSDSSAGGRSRKSSDEAVIGLQGIDPVRKPSLATTITPALPRNILDSDGSRTPSDDDYPGASPNYRLQSERQLEQRALDTSSHAYDRNLLSKIGGPNTPSRNSSYSSTSGEPAALASPGLADVRPPALKRLSMPERRRSSNDARYSITSNSRNNSSASIFSTTSFRSSSIFDPPEISRLLARRNHSLTYDDSSSSSHGGSHDSNMFPHEEFPMEEGQMKDLNINDHRSPGAPDDYSVGPRAGMKRRASSPQRETTRLDRSSVGSAAGANDLYHRRSLQQFPPRSSPSQRYNHPHHSSVSSASSLGHRTASLGSSYGLSVASSVTTLSSGRLSPSALSPAIDPELCPPFPVSKSLNPSPRSSISNPQLARGPDQTSQTPLSTMNEGPMVHQPVPGMLMCECCPKKPKKFKTEEDLRLHHMEKQYTCLYCPNRFKNKNEAERHQNSLHLRRHSWSCAALPTIEHAFHSSTANGGLTDICGYCGEEYPNPADWDERRNHLSVIHKFGECNQVKKFFRADHFRQHLKHSHAGTSGKWTNVLENACMRDEPPPIPMNRGGMGGPPHGMYAPMSSTLPLPSGMQQPLRQPETIDEVPQER
ncbi:hypothetical protein CAC42_1493 [Sphaceloma murrayae]|uniref:C2H2-type domain-containing protein n=1 Tax=Sphaceloma murrayae TaxID=2082308 RepID=A0A2K1QYA7_9PEZI|nr:hypothetical protein CAC42_1493 [Sphaceloma murrayae]